MKHNALTLLALVLLREPHLSCGDSGLLRKSSLDSSNISATHLHCLSNINSLSENDIYTQLQDLCLSTSKNSEFFLLFLSIHASTSELKLKGAQLVGCVYLLVLKTQSTSLVGQCKCCQQLSEH